jgi:hypothetical protein
MDEVIENKIEEKKKEDKINLKEEKMEKIKQAEIEERQVLDSMRKIKDYKQLISDAYTEMDTFVDMVVEGISFGCIIEGAGGTGKTHRTLQKCYDANVDVSLLNSFVTPAQFFVFLYQNREKDVMIFDDCYGIFSDKIQSIMKGAMWGIGKENKRIVCYETSKHLETEEGEIVPKSFEVTARFIIITNYLNKENEHTKAILSRINYCFVNVPKEELLRILEQISKQPYQDLSQIERTEVLKYLEEKSSSSTKDLNLRTYFKMMQFKQYCKKRNLGDKWQTLSLTLLKKDDRMSVVEKLMDDEDYPSENERFDKFYELTGDSRATYFRLKNQLLAIRKRQEKEADEKEKRELMIKKSDEKKREKEESTEEEDLDADANNAL